MDNWNRFKQHILERKQLYLENSNDCYECGDRVLGAVWHDKSEDMRRLIGVMDAMEFEEMRGINRE